jgi:hypothetical protein
MMDIVNPSLEPSSRLHLDWIIDGIFRPRATLPKIAAANRNVWLTPLLILTLLAVLTALVAGPIKKRAAEMGGLQLPDNFQYFSPEQQAQFQQAAQATQGPVFIYVFPALLGIARVWLGWLIVGGLLHLLLTLLGGRGNTGTSMNLVAWASLPLALREIVRIIYMLGSKQLVANPGLAGFAPEASNNLAVYAGNMLAQVDLYLLWHMALLVIGIKAANGLSISKVWGGVLITLFVVLSGQALFGLFGTLFNNLDIVRPFFF